MLQITMQQKSMIMMLKAVYIKMVIYKKYINGIYKNGNVFKLKF